MTIVALAVTGVALVLFLWLAHDLRPEPDEGPPERGPAARRPGPSAPRAREPDRDGRRTS